MNKRILAILIILAAIILITAVLLDLRGANFIYNWGNKLRNKTINNLEESFDYQVINTSKEDVNYQFELEVKKGPSLKQPLTAFWLADSTGAYI